MTTPVTTPPIIAPDEIRDGDLLIRGYQAGDGAALAAAKRASVEHLRPWMPWATETATAEEDEQLIRRFRGRYLLGEDFVLSIWRDDPAGPQFIGGTGFHRYKLSVGHAEIGMWIAAPWAGQGWGGRTLRLMLRWGFTDWPWQRLAWHCDARNIASARTAERGGLVFEGTLRRHLLDPTGTAADERVYALLKEEWQALQAPESAAST